MTSENKPEGEVEPLTRQRITPEDLRLLLPLARVLRVNGLAVSGNTLLKNFQTLKGGLHGLNINEEDLLGLEAEGNEDTRATVIDFYRAFFDKNPKAKPLPELPTPALAFEEEPTRQDTRSAAKPAAPVTTAGVQGTARKGIAAAVAFAGLIGVGIYNEMEPSPSGSIGPQDQVSLLVPATPAAAPSVQAATTSPVYTAVAAAFAGDFQEKLEESKATNELVHDFYVGDGGPHTWEGVRAIHPWSESSAALHDLEGKLSIWTGYKAVLASGELCNPESISDFVNCVAHDKNIPHAGLVALNLSEQITAIQDLKIMPTQVEGMHDKMRDDLPAKVREVKARAESGDLHAPKPFHYPTATSAAGAEDSLGSLYDAPAPMNLLKQQDASDATDVVDQATAHGGLNGLATWMENAQISLIKKGRGKNRELLPDFCAGVASEMRSTAERFDDLSPSGKEVALLDLKQKFFARMGELNNGDGHFKSEYLKSLSLQFNSALAEMLPPASEGVEGVQGRTRREVLATLPEGMFRPSVA